VSINTNAPAAQDTSSLEDLATQVCAAHANVVLTVRNSFQHTLSARIRNLRCEKCGRAFVASDVDTDGSATIRLTCGRCHDRPVEIETR
jgi:ribosomal protein S27AE